LILIGDDSLLAAPAAPRWRCSQGKPCVPTRPEVEYELHATKELLPRAPFEKNPELFRTSDQGQRTPDANCCVHSERALEIICENALAIAKVLRPTTGRFF